jgi:hypothetical protein
VVSDDGPTLELDEPAGVPEAVALAVPLLELALEAPDVVVLTPAVLEVAEATVLRLASAGSCPLTRVTAISSHAAMNSATVPATTRLRIMRTRARRAWRIDSPSALESVVWVIRDSCRRCRVVPAPIKIHRLRSSPVRAR